MNPHRPARPPTPSPSTTRRLGLRVLGATAFAACSFVPATAAAQAAYPNKPIRIIVPFPAGTSPDAIARLWSEKLAKSIGQAVIVENKPGAATIIGAQLVATAPADGYTLLYTAQNTMSINPYVYKTLPYKTDDLIPVHHVCAVPLVLITAAGSRVKSLADLMQAAKTEPGKLNFASYGIGQGTHVTMVHLLNNAGASMTHVPYKDGGILDVMSGVIDVSFEASTTALPQIKGGKIRALAVSSAKQLEALPDVPTIAETIPGFTADSWHGVLAPHGTPADIVAKIAAESQKIVDSPDFRAKLRDFALTPLGGTPGNFRKFIADESSVWAKVVKDNDIKVE